MLPNATQYEPRIRFTTKPRRRVFLLVATLGFVVVSVGLIVAGVFILAHDFTEWSDWLVACVGVVAGITGIKFFARISIGVCKNNLGVEGGTNLIISPAGLTDRTKIVGPLPIIPWSIVSQYDIVEHHGRGRASLVLRFHDIDAYERLIEPYRFVGWGPAIDPEDTGTPMHTIDLEYIQAHPNDIGLTIQQLTGLLPGAQTTATQ